MGARIWNLIQAPMAVDEVFTTILAEYDVEADRCQRDILALLEELVGSLNRIISTATTLRSWPLDKRGALQIWRNL
jgi:hypothetical protein